MRSRRPYALFLSVGLLAGCEMPLPQQHYEGHVKVRTVNGAIQDIEVKVPTSEGTTTVHNRRDADALITEMESLITDLKAARDLFPVHETPNRVVQPQQ